MIEELNSYLKKLCDDGVFPGCNYVIVTKSNRYYGSIGYKELVPNCIENSIDTMYDVASLTKVLVSIPLVSLLIKEEKLKLTDNISDYLDIKFKDIKVIHLITHSSGIKPLFDKFNLKSKDEFINNLDREFEPGTNVVYRDINYILLGFIIEKIYSDTLDNLVNELIFKPLDMDSTMYNPYDKERCAKTDLDNKGIVQDEKARFLNGVAAHAGIFSTVNNIGNFIEMVLHDGMFNNKKVLDLTCIDMWFTPLFISEDGVRKTIGWTYGKSSIMCNQVCSDDTIYHSGFTGGHILIDRGNDIGIVLLSNRVHPDRNVNKLKDLRQDINEYIYKLLKKYDEIY